MILVFNRIRSNFVLTCFDLGTQHQLLDVPVSVETGDPNALVNFYNKESKMEFGVGYDWDSIRKGYEVGDCRTLRNWNENIEKDEDYQTCAHVIPEMWVEGIDRAAGD